MQKNYILGDDILNEIKDAEWLGCVLKKKYNGIVYLICIRFVQENLILCEDINEIKYAD